MTFELIAYLWLAASAIAILVIILMLLAFKLHEHGDDEE
ncbi:Uncharacterised protein [Serratia proteamaculans]|nr:Uncharacterised protein [Serratia proteamaculans]